MSEEEHSCFSQAHFQQVLKVNFLGKSKKNNNNKSGNADVSLKLISCFNYTSFIFK